MNGSTVKIESGIDRPDGTRAIFDIQLSPQGTPEEVIFWDIDKTLVDVDHVYVPIREAMWTKAVAQEGIGEVGRVHEAGFKLGTMWRELYRMYGIYEKGRLGWKDQDVYEAEFLAPGKPGEHIDDIGDEYHEFADNLLRKFDEVAVRAIQNEYKKSPGLLTRTVIGPVVTLAKRYREIGVPMVGMSANPRGFIRSVCTYTGLADFLIDCASDDDAPGRKERKMEYLVGVLEGKGIRVPYQNLKIIGDSLVGDIGSGPRFIELMKNKGIRADVRGVLVVTSEEAAKQAREQIAESAELNERVEVIVVGDVV